MVNTVMRKQGEEAMQMKSMIEGMLCPDIGQVPPLVLLLNQQMSSLTVDPNVEDVSMNPCKEGYTTKNNALVMRSLMKWYSSTSREEFDE